MKKKINKMKKKDLMQKLDPLNFRDKRYRDSINRVDLRNNTFSFPLFGYCVTKEGITDLLEKIHEIITVNKEEILDVHYEYTDKSVILIRSRRLI